MFLLACKGIGDCRRITLVVAKTQNQVNSDADGEHVTLKTKLQAQEPNKVTSPAKFSVITPLLTHLGLQINCWSWGRAFVFFWCVVSMFFCFYSVCLFLKLLLFLSLLPSLFSPCSSLSLLPSLFPPSKIVPWPLMVYSFELRCDRSSSVIVFGWTVGVPVDTAWMHQGL